MTESRRGGFSDTIDREHPPRPMPLARKVLPKTKAKREAQDAVFHISLRLSKIISNLDAADAKTACERLRHINGKLREWTQS